MWTTKKSIVLALLLVVSASFCLSTPRFAFALTEVGQNPESKLAAIDSISVSGEGDDTELVIKLTSPATYTSYKTTAPLRLVVDLSQATQGSITTPLVINKGNFKTITVSRYDTDAGVLTRVDIELVKDAEAIISAAPDQKGELRITFPPLPVQADQSATGDTVSVTPEESTSKASAAKDAEPVKTSGEPTGTAALSDVKETVNGTANSDVIPYRSLTSVYVKNDSIVLAINGGAGDFKTFRLNKPERFIVDLFDVKSGLADRIVPVNAAGVASARLGLYPDKVRVVLDAVNGSFPEAVAEKSSEGVTIALNVKSAVDNPNTRLMTAHAEKTAEPITHIESQPVTKAIAVPSGSAYVEMIDFQVIEGISRVSVKVAGDVVAEAPVKSPGYVTLTIKNTNLPKRLQRSKLQITCYADNADSCQNPQGRRYED